MVVTYNLRRVTNDIGRRIAELRRERGWTQADLAEALDKTPQWISAIERGKPLSVETLVRLANIFKIEIIVFFDPPTTPKNTRRGRPPISK